MHSFIHDCVDREKAVQNILEQKTSKKLQTLFTKTRRRQHFTILICSRDWRHWIALSVIISRQLKHCEIFVAFCKNKHPIVFVIRLYMYERLFRWKKIQCSQPLTSISTAKISKAHTLLISSSLVTTTYLSIKRVQILHHLFVYSHGYWLNWTRNHAIKLDSNSNQHFNINQRMCFICAKSVEPIWWLLSSIAALIWMMNTHIGHPVYVCLILMKLA